MFGKKRDDNGGNSPRRIPMPEPRGAVSGPRYTLPPPPAFMQAHEVSQEMREQVNAKRCPLNGAPCGEGCAWYGNSGCAMVAGVGELYALVEAVANAPFGNGFENPLPTSPKE